MSTKKSLFAAIMVMIATCIMCVVGCAGVRKQQEQETSLSITVFKNAYTEEGRFVEQQEELKDTNSKKLAEELLKQDLPDAVEMPMEERIYCAEVYDNVTGMFLMDVFMNTKGAVSVRTFLPNNGTRNPIAVWHTVKDKKTKEKWKQVFGILDDAAVQEKTADAKKNHKKETTENGQKIQLGAASFVLPEGWNIDPDRTDLNAEIPECVIVKGVSAIDTLVKYITLKYYSGPTTKEAVLATLNAVYNSASLTTEESVTTLSDIMINGQPCWCFKGSWKFAASTETVLEKLGKDLPVSEAFNGEQSEYHLVLPAENGYLTCTFGASTNIFRGYEPDDAEIQQILESVEITK